MFPLVLFLLPGVVWLPQLVVVVRVLRRRVLLFGRDLLSCCRFAFVHRLVLVLHTPRGLGVHRWVLLAHMLGLGVLLQLLAILGLPLLVGRA